MAYSPARPRCLWPSNVAAGHISYGGVVIDGQYLTFHEFAAILSAHEGWQFKLEIVDPYDTFP
jgi:hypothetical protein